MGGNMSKLILDCYGGTGAWSKPYKKAGYTVIVIDINQGKEFDIRLLTHRKCWKTVYGILFAPPCTDLAGSGARWWKQKGEQALLDALSMVDACFRLVWLYKPTFWALENPVGRLSSYLGNPQLVFQPCDYAGYLENPISDLYTKRTCLWGNFNIPSKKPMKPILGSKMHKLGPSKNRSQLRSITPSGFAQAFFESNP
jgi:hypothetical protein